MTFSIMLQSSCVLSRPIQHVGDKVYFAANLPLKNAKGSVEHRWLIANQTFDELYSDSGLEGHKPFDAAPFLIQISGTPRPGSTLSADAYQRHVIAREEIPNLVDTFHRASTEIDRFVEFNGAFAKQKDMADFLTCWVISTYANDAFDTVGYIWPNGERASGKTQCLKTLMSLAFMGQTVTASSSFASVRDEAALGATLGFDDCEQIKQMENDKRELLLAGNTRGAGFMHKVPGRRDGTWETKHVDCFAPRAFTSIGLPDDVLASRTILLPLMRSNDLTKTRRKPTNLSDWGTPPTQLRDSIWLNVVAGLQSIRDQKTIINARSEIAGRDFDIFQGPLAIASWLDSQGVKGLLDRMLVVMEAYHTTKQKNLLPSVERVVLQTLRDKLDEEAADCINITTKSISISTREVLDRWDITDPELTSLDVQKVGMMLGRIGFAKSGSHGKNRSWIIRRADLEVKAKAAGVTLEDSREPTVQPFDDGAGSKGNTLGDLPWEWTSGSQPTSTAQLAF